MSDTIETLRAAMAQGAAAEKAFIEKWRAAQPDLEALATYYARLTAGAGATGLLGRVEGAYPTLGKWLRRAGMMALGVGGAGAIENAGGVVDVVGAIGGLLAKILPGL